jgi:hypothetical protein
MIAAAWLSLPRSDSSLTLITVFFALQYLPNVSLLSGRATSSWCVSRSHPSTIWISAGVPLASNFGMLMSLGSGVSAWWAGLNRVSLDRSATISNTVLQVGGLSDPPKVSCNAMNAASPIAAII